MSKPFEQREQPVEERHIHIAHTILEKDATAHTILEKDSFVLSYVLRACC